MLLTVMLPVLAVQGIMVKIRTPLLPEASGDRWGLIEGPGEPVLLVVFGESTVSGVGVDSYDQTLAARSALALGKGVSRGVRWLAVGHNGMMARQLRRFYIRQAKGLRVDIIMICLGVNDVLHMHGPGRYSRDLHDLICEMRGMFGSVPIVLCGIAPMGFFPAIPQPLRYVLGLRAKVLDRAAASVAKSFDRVCHCPMPGSSGLIQSSFASDGFHPNADGYARLGDLFGRCMTDCMDMADV